MVAEDVAIEEPGLAGRRGLAGVALVHKVRAGAFANADVWGWVGWKQGEGFYSLTDPLAPSLVTRLPVPLPPEVHHPEPHRPLPCISLCVSLSTLYIVGAGASRAPLSRLCPHLPSVSLYVSVSAF